MMTAVPIMKAVPGWSPSPFQAPAAPPPPPPAPEHRHTLAQTVTATPTTPPNAVYQPQPSFIDSALVGAIFTGVGTVAYGTLTAGAYKANWKKSTVIFGALTALLGLATIGNLYEVRQR